ncbi:potassium transporter [Nitrosopumilus zosterae]|uniref:Potassium transporter n=1 Tax=Nitrosopumilus zosterae TaxID=718286 RepID=A0A2S2KU34_9ARCH|nr:cation:proton antiporter [Nitrosopumilus zosterae]BDQ29931.1 cation:proton antiporter [Nitrosopumilus zosterae]GBH34968.1 potassium transporter [Nitrosopumilus zosterae]
MVSAEITEFISLLTVLLGGGMIGAWLMHKIKFPTMIGFILIGIIAGPFGLGIVKDTELINLLAEFGIVILLFVVGLEFSLEKLRRIGSQGILVGTIQLSIVFFLGYVTALSFGWTHIEGLYLGSILSITSTVVSLRLLRDMNLVKTKEMGTIVMILIIEDLAAVLLLAVLGNVSKGSGFEMFDIGMMILQSIVFFVLAVVIGTKIVPKIIEYVSNMKMEEAAFITSLALGFGLATLAHFMGLSTAIGAFLMGLIIASSKQSESIIKKILPIRDFFGVIFFVSIGMLFNIYLFPEAIWIALPIIAIAVFGKFLGNFFAASIAGNNLVSAATIATVMVPIAEFSFILAKQGVDTGSLRESIYPVILLVSLGTMFVIPLLLRVTPTLADSRSAIPMGFLNSVYITGQFFRKTFSNSSDGESHMLNQIFKKYGSRFVVNLVIIITILSAMDYFAPEIVMLLEDPNVPFFMDSSVFVSIITILLLAYPVFSLVGRMEKVVTAISNSITMNIGSQSTAKPVHRIIRNILSIGLVLLLVAIFITFTTKIEDIPNMPIIISTIGLLISAPLILDTILTVQKITHSNMVGLLSDDVNEDKDE